MKTGNIGKTDERAEQSPLQPYRNDKPEKVWDHTREPATTDTHADELSEREPVTSSGQPCSSDEVQLRELLSAWSRASEEVREQFLAKIGVSPPPQAKADPGLTDDEPSQEPAPSQEPVASESEPMQSAESSATGPEENALFEMWKDYKHNPQVTARQCVLNGCPSEYQDSHFAITERLEPFRAAAKAATQEQREQFLELTQAA